MMPDQDMIDKLVDDRIRLQDKLSAKSKKTESVRGELNMILSALQKIGHSLSEVVKTMEDNPDAK